MKNKLSAFTLAETLIVLAIIGVVAAMTIPTLVQNYKEGETVTRLKKAYSIISQAYQLAIAENGTPDTWGLNTSQSNFYDEEEWSEPDRSSSSRTKIVNILSKYMKHNKINTVKGDKETSKGEYSIYLNDGTKFYNFYVDHAVWGTNDGDNGSNCSANYGTSKALQTGCFSFFVDLNGDNEPNEGEKDRFKFLATKFGIIPSGAREVAEDYSWSFKKQCLNSDEKDSCTGWVIENENMDYLHCDDLSWDGKHKCD